MASIAEDWVADEAERADDYRRWRNRASTQNRVVRCLLTLIYRALLSGQTGRDGWQPRPAWAARYALATGAGAQKEFEQVLSYIDESETQARQEREASEAAAQRQRQLEQGAARGRQASSRSASRV